MKVTVQLLDSAEEQRARGDLTIIDPQAVVVNGKVSAFWNGDFRLPIGEADNFRVVDGDLWADIEIPRYAMAIGGQVIEQEGDSIRAMDLLEVSVVPRPVKGW